MKATGFIELVVIMCALVVGLPLFILTVTSASTMTTSYIHDKSTWNIASDIEYEINDAGLLVPKTHITPHRLTLAQATVLPYVQDEYSPDTGRNIDYNFDSTSVQDETTPDYEINIPNHSRGYKYVNDELVGEVAPRDKIEERRDKNFYWVWNTKRNTWMITNEFINVLGY